MLQKYSYLLPALILAVGCMSTIATAVHGEVELAGEQYAFALSLPHYFGLLATAVTLGSFFLLRSYYKYFLLLTFALGACGLLQFTALQSTWGISIGVLSVRLSTILLLVGLSTYLVYYRQFKACFSVLLKPSLQKASRVQQEELVEFKERFSRKSTEELTRIVAENKLVAAATTAARELLQERQKSA